MADIKNYSAIIAKTCAMSKNLLKQKDFEHILNMTSLLDVVKYLRYNDSYFKIFQDAKEEDLARRENIEYYINDCAYNDFLRLYKFAGADNKTFLKLYFKRYEINLLKEHLTRILNHNKINRNLKQLSDFVGNFSKLDIESLKEAEDLTKFFACFENSFYHNSIKHLITETNASLFDYEMALDLSYFKFLWSKKNMLFKDSDSKVLKNTWGSIFDLLNIMWIYRCKEYYNIPPSNIKSLLIPAHKHINKNLLDTLIKCNSLDEINNVLNNNYYFQKFNLDNISIFEQNYTAIIGKMIFKNASYYPFSIAPLYSYIFRKEHEVAKLIVAVECIRYKLSPFEAMVRIKNA